jgi:hypothetical protein
VSTLPKPRPVSSPGAGRTGHLAGPVPIFLIRPGVIQPCFSYAFLEPVTDGNLCELPSPEGELTQDNASLVGLPFKLRSYSAGVWAGSGSKQRSAPKLAADRQKLGGPG